MTGLCFRSAFLVDKPKNTKKLSVGRHHKTNDFKNFFISYLFIQAYLLLLGSRSKKLI